VFGPTFPFELAIIGRRKSLFAVRMALALFMALLIWANYNEVARARGIRGRARASDTARLADAAYHSLGILSIAAVLLLAPAYVGTALASEKNRHAFDLVRASDLVNREIVLSKFVPRLLVVLMHAATVLPVLAMAALWGSISADQWFGLAVIIMVCAVSSASLAMLASVLVHDSRNAVFVAYVAVFLLNLGPTLIERVVGAIAGPIVGAATLAPKTVWTNVDVILHLLGVTNPFQVFRGLVLSIPTGTVLNRRALELALIHLGLGAICLTWGVLAVRRIDLTQRGHRRARHTSRGAQSVGDDAMRWKEWKLPLAGQVIPGAGWHGILIQLLFLPVVLAVGIANRTSLGSLLEIQGFVVALVAMMLVIVKGMGTVVAERNRDRWDSLLATPLTAEEIVGAKIAGAMVPLRGATFFLTPAWLIGIALNAVWSICFLLLIVSIWSFGRAAAVISVWGSLRSLRERRRIPGEADVRFGAIEILTMAFCFVGAAWFLYFLLPLVLFMVTSPLVIMGLISLSAGQTTVASHYHHQWLAALTAMTLFSSLGYLWIGSRFETNAKRRFDAWLGRIP